MIFNDIYYKDSVLEKMEKIHTIFEDTNSVEALIKLIDYNKFCC